MDYYDTYYFLVTVSHYYVNMNGTVNTYIFFYQNGHTVGT